MKKSLTKKQKLILQVLYAGYRLRWHLAKSTNTADNDSRVLTETFLSELASGLVPEDKYHVLLTFIRKKKI